MGIETILLVLGVVAVIAVVVGAKKSKRKVEEHTRSPGSPPP